MLSNDGGNDDAYIFERYVEGRSLQVSGVISGDQAGILATYETLRRQFHLGPGSELLSLADHTLAEPGSTCVQQLGRHEHKGVIMT